MYETNASEPAGREGAKRAPYANRVLVCIRRSVGRITYTATPFYLPHGQLCVSLRFTRSLERFAGRVSKVFAEFNPDLYALGLVSVAPRMTR